MKLLRHYGSSGAGNRTGRTVGTRKGRRGVATLDTIAPRIIPARLDWPTKDQLEPYMRALRCWWCDDGRTFKSLSQHLVRAHHISLQAIRDTLLVPKGHSFIDASLSERFAVRGRLLYNPNILCNKGNPRELSLFGKKSQKTKAHIARRPGGPLPPLRVVACKICGNLIHGGQRLTCSDKCRKALQSTVGQANIPQVLKAGTVSLRKRQELLADGIPKEQVYAFIRPKSQHPCLICGTAIIGHAKKKSCSSRCEHELRSKFAKSRSDHWALVKRRSSEARKDRAIVRRCSVEGCLGKHLAKGLCGKHYQRQIASHKTWAVE